MSNTDRNPSNGAQGSSYMYQMGTSPNTRTAVSQKIRILAPSYGATAALSQIGVLSSFSPTESRSIDSVKAIGFGDKIMELVPSITEAGTASVERALMYLSNLWQSTGYAAGVDGPVRSLRHHKWPFDIEQQIVFSTIADMDLDAAGTGFNGTSGSFNGGVKAIAYPQVTAVPESGPTSGGHTAIITLFEGAWWNDHSTSFSSDSGLVVESGSLTFCDKIDWSSVYGEFLQTGNDPSNGQLGSAKFGNVAVSGGGLG